MNDFSTVPGLDPKDPSDRVGHNQPSSGPQQSKTSRGSADVDDDDDDDEKKPGRERRKIEIKFIQDKSRRHITFSKRRHGIMKKAYELSVLTGTQVLLLVVSETGLVYTYTTPKLQPMVSKPEGKHLIQACLNAPDSPPEPPVDPTTTGSIGHREGNAPPSPGGEPSAMPGPGAQHGIPGQVPPQGQMGHREFSRMNMAAPGLDPTAMMMQQPEGLPQQLPDGYLPQDYPGYIPGQRYYN